MPNPKISLITVCFNAVSTIEGCIASVVAQGYSNVEYIIIDGASTDGTLGILNQHRNQIDVLISEPDNGLYDAMNKGIALATGDIVGVLNADDFFADNEVLQAVADAFVADVEVIYGNISIINAGMQQIRRWNAGAYKHKKLKWGWMPPHPAFYARHSLFKQFGNYNLNYGTAADYELMLRILYTCKAKTNYLNKVLVKMRAGGASNGSLAKRLKAWANDYKAMKKHALPMPAFSLLLKPLRKFSQYLIKL